VALSAMQRTRTARGRHGQQRVAMRSARGRRVAEPRVEVRARGGLPPDKLVTLAARGMPTTRTASGAHGAARVAQRSAPDLSHVPPRAEESAPTASPEPTPRAHRAQRWRQPLARPPNRPSTRVMMGRTTVIRHQPTVPQLRAVETRGRASASRDSIARVDARHAMLRRAS